MVVLKKNRGIPMICVMLALVVLIVTVLTALQGQCRLHGCAG